MQIFLFKNQTLGDILGPWQMGCNVGIAHAASENEKSEYSDYQKSEYQKCIVFKR